MSLESNIRDIRKLIYGYMARVLANFNLMRDIIPLCSRATTTALYSWANSTYDTDNHMVGKASTLKGERCLICCLFICTTTTPARWCLRWAARPQPLPHSARRRDQSSTLEAGQCGPGEAKVPNPVSTRPLPCPARVARGDSANLARMSQRRARQVPRVGRWREGPISTQALKVCQPPADVSKCRSCFDRSYSLFLSSLSFLFFVSKYNRSHSKPGNVSGLRIDGVALWSS